MSEKEGVDSLFFRMIQGVLILGLTIFPTIIAWQQKKEETYSV